MKQSLTFVLIVLSLFSFAQKDTLHVYYFNNNQVSTIIVLEDNREGFAKAYNRIGEKIYSSNIRRFGGHASVEFKHHSNGVVREAKYFSAPDGGIQWYESTTSFDENGVKTNFEEFSHEHLLSPIHAMPQPIVQEVVECAVIHENIIVIHNHCNFSVEYTFKNNVETKQIVVKPGEVKEVLTYISAQITQKPLDFFQIHLAPSKKRERKKLYSLSEVKKNGDSKTAYNFHVFESSINGKN